MKYVSIAPTAPLAEYIERFWYSSDAPQHRKVRVVPSGTMELVFNLNEDNLGGWNRILLEVSDINAEATRLRASGVKFRREDIVSGPGGSQFWIVDPSGNLVELFQPNQ